MFAKTIIDSDAFLDMPLSTQALYFHLSMRADDEGFINNPKKIQRMIGASDDDLKVLIAKSFIIPFESGIVVIKHWKIHNYIRGDRIKHTVYSEERQLLDIKDNGAYTYVADICQTDDSQVSGKCQHRLGKDSIGKDSIGKVNKEPKEKPLDSMKTMVDNTELSDNLKNTIKEWLDYKKEIKKPYKSERGFQQFINIVAKYSLTYSDDEIISVINKSMASGYQGVVWDWLEKGKKTNSYVDAINNRMNVVDDWLNEMQNGGE